jgi:anaerobic C4-dicarboxylate transporter
VIQRDRTGTTRRGKFVVDGSFTVPLVSSVVVAVAVGLGVAALVG